MKFRLMAPVIAFVSLWTMTVPAHASFIIDPNPGGDKFFIGIANHDVSNFSGTVSSNVSGPVINVATATTVDTVDTGSGWSNITPHTGLLTDLIFTPVDPTLFSDFSFRGQLASDGFSGTVDVKVTDQANATWNLQFTGLAGPNVDFAHIGVMSTDGGTIKTVEIMTPLSTLFGQESFKEVKQIDFSYAAGSPPCPTNDCRDVPEPNSLTLLGLGLIASAFALRRRVFLQGRSLQA
jgi:PEP-CTERM motif